MNCTIIAAIGKNREIGEHNNLPWHLPKDMQFFKETTTGNSIVMGRKNWESIPEKFRPLPNRKNIVLTRDLNYNAKGAVLIHDWDELEQHLEKEKSCFIIGGAEIFKYALANNMVNTMYITHINASFEGATIFFPPIDLSLWKSEEILKHKKDPNNPFDFTIKKYTK